jgi:serine/threonine-protein kinase RsbW
MTRDRVTLTVPAKGEYAKTVRMTASALVSRMGMSYDDVDDVRIAAEEAFVYAADSVGEGAELTFVFEIAESSIEINVTLGAETDLDDEEVERRVGYATFILESVCDSFELSSDEQGNQSLRLVKNAEIVDGL